jgi:hypothetical protein
MNRYDNITPVRTPLPEAQVHESEVSRAIRMLHGQIDRANELVNALNAKVEPIMSPANPTAPKDEKQQSLPSTKLGSELTDCYWMLKARLDELNAIICRIEL